jgi:hemolysin III
MFLKWKTSFKKSAMKKTIKNTKALREPWNFYTHGFAAIAVIVFYLIIQPQIQSETARWVSSLYIAASFFGFITSAIYHGPIQTEKEIAFWRKMDHSGIFITIAATYTPTCLFLLDKPIGTYLIVYMWAILGISLKLMNRLQKKSVSLTFFLAFGWTLFPFIGFMIEKVDVWGLVLMFGGGLAYTIGAIFYSLDKKRPDYTYHAIWHLFVMLGAAMHLGFNYAYLILKAN